MPMQRRNILKSIPAALAAAAVAPPVRASSGASEAGAEALKTWTPPSAKNPVLACFNENPLGLSAAARKALAASADRCNRYPFAEVEKLRAACAKFVGGRSEQIVLSQGSAEAIRASIEAHKSDDVQLVVPELTYGDGEMCAVRNGIPVVRVKMLDDWAIDIEGMKKAVASHKGPSIVYFVNPNNPTSTLADCAAFNAWVRSKPAGVIFLVDEAYGEFVEDESFVSAATLVAEGLDNVIVLKTFSKIFAMAGLRLGFAYAAKPVAEKVRNHIAYDIFQNVPAIACAMAEIGDEAFITESRRVNAASKKVMTDALTELGMRVLPSSTNFVFAKLPEGVTLEAFSAALKSRHILVGRAFPPATDWVRISMVSEADTAYAADCLRALRSEKRI